MSEKRRGPTLIEDDLDDLPPAPPSPAEAPPVDAAEPEATTAALKIAASGGGGTLSKIFWAALLGLLSMGLGLWFWETVESLVARNVWLGRIALGFGGLLGVTLFLMALKELASLARIRRIDRVRDGAERARATRDRSAALATVKIVDRLYRGRPELAAARASVTAKAGDVMDGDALIDLAERDLMAPLDAAAEAAVRRGARDVAAATALLPLALIDVLTALAVNLRMIRRIAEIYGGRAGWLGSWRLLRAVAAHLIAAGAIAVGDDLIGPALGGGAVAKVSRRFGEGVVNGALTARIGIAAMEVCRPLPFHVRKRPSVATLIAGVFRTMR